LISDGKHFARQHDSIAALERGGHYAVTATVIKSLPK
jgi:hypothetical protein